jgi:hypothetical protein
MTLIKTITHLNISKIPIFMSIIKIIKNLINLTTTTKEKIIPISTIILIKIILSLITIIPPLIPIEISKQQETLPEKTLI